MKQKISFKIIGMDCVEEVSTLKREVGPLVGSQEHLVFDVVNGKMTILLQNNVISEDTIVNAVAKTGMKAIPWGKKSQPGGDGIWQHYGRLLMSVASGFFITAAFLTRLFSEESFIKAFTSHNFSFYTIILYLAAILCGGWFIAPKALFAARKFRPDMNFLMAIAVIGAVAIGEWFEAAAVTFLFSVALLLESWSVGRARKAIQELMELTPQVARSVSSESGDIIEMSVENIPVGVTVIVRPGEKIPLDGVLTKGSTHINQAPITGESVPVAKVPGDNVFAGTINGGGAFEFKSTKPASDTTLARIIHMVEEAQSRRAPSEQWVEKFAKIYTPAMMVLAILIAVVPPLFFAGQWSEWFYEALVILVIACPCALVISTPVSIVAGLASAAKAGVLIKGGTFLEAPAHIKAVALDKTGTLTYGTPEVQKIITLNNHSETELLSLAAALEAHSTHPIAGAILKKAELMNVTYITSDNFKIIQGKGAEGIINGIKFRIGSHRFIEETGMENEEFHKIATDMEDAGHSLVAVWNDSQICGLISVADTIRKEAADVVKAIKKEGVEKVVMLTGDNLQTASAVAAATGVDDFMAELLPEDKVKAVAELTKTFGKTAMIGDGVNDAPAMAASTLGIAMGAVGTDAAIETADIALMSDDLSKLAWIIGHSRKTLFIIKQNIIFALGLKVLFIVLAMAGLATLWMAIAADMGASLLVIFNGLRLLKKTS